LPLLKSKAILGTVKLPKPHAGQKAVFGAPERRFNWACMGRRWRKTSGVMAFVAVPEALRNGTVLWTAPTADQTRVGWAEAEKMVGQVARFNKTEATCYFPGGGKIIFRSMDDPNNARGHTATKVIVDEAAEVKEEAWYEVLRPTLLDTKGGAWLIFTPKGRNWVWREWMAARDRDDSYAWQAPALGARVDPDTQKLIRVPHPLENTDLDFDELAQIWNTTPERSFRQEILAEFLDDGGGVFRGVTACISGTLMEPYRGRFAIGADFARQHDFSVLTVMDMQSKAVVDWQRFNQIDWFSQQGKIAQLYHKWKANDSQVTVLAEKNMAGDVLIEMLQRSGVPVTPFSTNYKTKRQLIEALQLAIERRLLTYPDIPQLVAELQAYEQERLASGIIRFRAPQGMFDDCVISLALAWRLAKFGNQPKNMGPFKFLSNAPKAKKSLLQEYKQGLREKRRAG
jgi:hypothetical protein